MRETTITMAEEGRRKFKRVLLKLSGEALREPGSQENISPPIVESIASQIKAAHQNGLEIAFIDWLENSNYFCNSLLRPY